MEMKTKANKWGLLKFKAFAQWSKLKEGEKTVFRMGENDSKSNNWQRMNLQNIQVAHAAQYQISEQPNQKVGRRPKQTFLQRRHVDG